MQVLEVQPDNSEVQYPEIKALKFLRVVLEPFSSTKIDVTIFVVNRICCKKIANRERAWSFFWYDQDREGLR